MSKELCVFWAKKFFPHLLPEHGQQCIIEIWKAHNKPTP